jgi:cold shock CspA family protein
MPKLSKQPTHCGIVVVARMEEGKGYGFIEPTDGNGERGKNVFFGRASLQASSIERGDLVNYVLSTNPDERGPSAYRVWIKPRAVADERREHITTIAGEFDI